MLAKKLGWEVLDRDLLDYMAEKYHLPRALLDFVDEKTANWLHESFAWWLDRQSVSQAEFVAHLGKMVLLAAQHGKVVFVGRGAQYFLPRDKGLAVRVVASMEARIERTKQRRNVSDAEAKRFIDEMDRNRHDFIARYFHQDVADPHGYDLVVNVDQFGQDEASDYIAELFRRRFP